jgi:hypothetical protein
VYLGTQEPHFELPGAAFGYGRCGILADQEFDAGFALPLSRERVKETTLTIEALIAVLNFVRIGGADGIKPRSNKLQLIWLDYCCSRGGLNSHALGGNFHPEFGKWCVRRGQDISQEEPQAFSEESFIGQPFPHSSVKKAMRAAWSATAPRGSLQFKSSCRAGLKPSGHFALVCLGSNVAPFPDLTPVMDAEWGGRFTCWNMDSAHQQLTLLAGVAALYELADRDLGV